MNRAEAELVGLFREIDRTKAYLPHGYPSLFAYANRGLGLSEAVAYQIITVCRKAVPEFQEAIARGEIPVSKAKSIVAAVNRENVSAWIELARSKSTRELERLVAQEMGTPIEKKVALSPETLALLERVQVVISQKAQRPASFDEALRSAALEFLRRNDPLAKLTLHGKSGALRRDRGKCQFILADGKICGEEKWVHVHHVRPKCEGGTDEPENLTTLCAAHHRLVHAARVSFA